MRNSKVEEADFRAIAEELSVPPEEVKNVINSFFGIIGSEARRLPFNNPRKIYSRAAFDKHGSVFTIPYIGRLGPAYSKYLQWRVNESKKIDMITRPIRGSKLLPSEVEAIAEAVLDGKEFDLRNKRKVGFERVWLVGEDGKRQARQAVLKKEK